MTPQDDIVNLAQRKASQSRCRYKVSAVGLDRKGRVLGCTMNRHRLSHRGGGVHAEIALIRKYGERLRSIIICRTNKRGDLLDIHACPACAQVASKLKIKIYSIKEILKEEV